MSKVFAFIKAHDGDWCKVYKDRRIFLEAFNKEEKEAALNYRYTFMKEREIIEDIYMWEENKLLVIEGEILVPEPMKVYEEYVIK